MSNYDVALFGPDAQGFPTIDHARAGAPIAGGNPQGLLGVDDGIDRVRNIERPQFADGTVAIDKNGKVISSSFNSIVDPNYAVLYTRGGGSDSYGRSGTAAGATVNLGVGTAASADTGTDTLVGIANVVGSTGNDRFVVAIGDGRHRRSDRRWGHGPTPAAAPALRGMRLRRRASHPSN